MEKAIYIWGLIAPKAHGLSSLLERAGYSGFFT
jgi:hypothetical protein